MDTKIIEFAVKGLIFYGDEFLGVHKANIKSERFELPGGRMVFGETAEDTLIREMQEEVGLKVKPVRLIDTWNYIANENKQVTGIIYLCEYEGTPDIVLSAEHDRYEWMKTNTESLSKMNKLFGPKMEKWNWEDIKSYLKQNE